MMLAILKAKPISSVSQLISTKFIYHGTFMSFKSINPAYLFSQSCEYSVKQLDWCAPSSDTSKAKKYPTNISQPGSTFENDVSENVCDVDSNLMKPLPFGIVAAMSKNRIIGLDGKIPWSVPHDRQYFRNLTKGKLIVLGKNSYHDTQDEKNISHASKCWVLSTTHDSSRLGSARVVRSLTEALNEMSLDVLEKQGYHPLESESKLLSRGTYQVNDDLECWVCGGERVYEEALRHPSACELHLTVLDIEVDTASSLDGTFKKIARFPAKYRWDRYFTEVSRRFVPGDNVMIPDCTYYVYRRRPERKAS
jgi:dihydrofolate reductase